MGWTGKHNQVCYSTLNWGPLDHAYRGPQLRVLLYRLACVCACRVSSSVGLLMIFHPLDLPFHPLGSTQISCTNRHLPYLSILTLLSGIKYLPQARVVRQYMRMCVEGGGVWVCGRVSDCHSFLVLCFWNVLGKHNYHFSVIK